MISHRAARCHQKGSYRALLPRKKDWNSQFKERFLPNAYHFPPLWSWNIITSTPVNRGPSVQGRERGWNAFAARHSIMPGRHSLPSLRWRGGRGGEGREWGVAEWDCQRRGSWSRLTAGQSGLGVAIPRLIYRVICYQMWLSCLGEMTGFWVWLQHYPQSHQGAFIVCYKLGLFICEMGILVMTAPLCPAVLLWCSDKLINSQ